MSCKLIRKCQNNCGDQNCLNEHSRKTFYLITLFRFIHSVLKLQNHINGCCDYTDHNTGNVDVRSAKYVFDITVCSTAKQVDKCFLILDGNCHTIQHNVTQSSECKHSGKCHDKRRDTYIGDPKALECTDKCTNQNHD